MTRTTIPSREDVGPDTFPRPRAARAKRDTTPMQYASGYTLDLYCDTVNEDHPWDSFPHQFAGETFGECARYARRRGWIIRRESRTATCPICSGKRKR